MVCYIHYDLLAHLNLALQKRTKHNLTKAFHDFRTGETTSRYVAIHKLVVKMLVKMQRLANANLCYVLMNGLQSNKVGI